MSLPDPPADSLPANDFRVLFESAPDLLVVLDTSDDHHFVAASDAYMQSIMAERAAIIGRPVFTVFPDDPDDPATASHQSLRAALDRVRRQGVAETLPVYQYNIRRSEAQGGGTEERHWRTSVSPVFTGREPREERKPAYLLIRAEDVTALVFSNRAGDDARSRLEATLGAAEVGTWVWEVGPDRVTADENLARMFGVDTRDAAGGPLEHYTRHIHEEDLPRVRAGIQEAVREGRRFEMEYRIRQSDGSLRWVAARGWAERDEVGRPTRFPGVIIDITNRKWTEAALRESDERMRLAIDLTGLGTFDYDPLTDSLQWSDGCRQMFGVAPGEPVSYETTFVRGLHPDDRERTLAAVNDALRPGGPGQYDIEYRTVSPLDDRERWVAARGRTLFDDAGQPQRFVGTVLDITARKGMEEAALRRSEQLQKLAAISARLNTAHDVTSVLGIVTEEARALIGAQQAVASVATIPEMGKVVTVVSHADKDRPETPAPLDAAAASLLVEDLQETVRVTRAEAEGHPALRSSDAPGAAGGWLAAPLVGRNTRRLGVIQLVDKSTDDFTEDDEALLSQLAQIATVAIENARLYEELRRNDKRKDEFLAMLAHELRNPLAAIRNAVALGSDPTDAAEIEWAMEVINRQMRQLSRLIDDLLDVSRITQGKVQLRKEPLDAAAVLNSAVQSVRPLMEERQHELTVSLRPGTLQLEADPTRLEQIVVNLLSNAAKYTEKSGEISLRARQEDGKIVIRVRDNGAGIPPEKLPQMFELFAQGDRTLARSEGGLGIGLTLVRSLTEMHGGTIQAFSEGQGKGSEFVVSLPASPAAPTGDEAAVSPAASSRAARTPAVALSGGKVRRVLVVDDNVDSARGTALILSRSGHEVRVVYDGPGALREAAELRPEFVLLDIGLPGMDGYEVARRLRGDPALAGVKLVAVSGYGQESDRRRSQEAGFDQHLVKPVDPGVLLELLR